MSDRSAAVRNAEAKRSPRWRWCRFDALTVFEVERIYAVRQQVFAIEQQCIYLDADGCDEAAYHLAAWSDDERLPVAYARLVDPGVKYPEPSIGRVLTAPAARRTGLGRELVDRMVVGCAEAWPGRAIRISAQAHLQTFYEVAGFSAVGAPYAEDGIPHIEMVRPARI
jgi:ElaA protein